MVSFNSKFIILKIMKGVKNAVFLTLLYVVIMFMMLGLVFAMLSPVAKANLIEEITGKKTEDTLELVNKQNPFPINWVEHIFTSGTNYQLSEVACEIADKINTDFMASLYDKSRAVGKGENCEKEWCILKNGVGRFRLSDTGTGPTDNTWRIAMSAKNCSVCEEPPGAGNLIGNLDEVCINYNLKAKNNALCSGPIIVGGKIVEFGNYDCGGKRNGDAWQGHCDNDGNIDFCDDNNKFNKILWSGDKTKYNAYLASDDKNELIDWYITVMYWKSNSVVLNKESNEYIYGILWDSNNKRYDILFEQTPIVFSTNNKDDLINVYKNMTDNFRFNRLGNWYNDTRAIEHFTFTPTADISFQEFWDLFSKDTNLEVKFELCNDFEDCMNSEPVKRGSTACKNEGFSYVWDPITIKSNMDKLGSFTVGKTYEILVKNWVGYWFGGKYTPISPNQVCYDYFDRTVSIYET
jgi:hypothetical protein